MLIGIQVSCLVSVLCLTRKNPDQPDSVQILDLIGCCAKGSSVQLDTGIMIRGPWLHVGRGCVRTLLRREIRLFSTLGLGVDEAGRGAVLGPLVISSVLLDADDEKALHEMGVKDSKQMTPERRFQLYDEILQRTIRSCSIHMSSLSIDKQRKNGFSMNQIEENHIFQLLEKYSKDPVDEVVIDAFVSRKNRLFEETQRIFPDSHVRCEFHADANYGCVACASVVAKVERDRAIQSLSEELEVNLGTGYPHDPLSIEYIRSYVREHGKAPVIARSSWITTQRILTEVLKEQGGSDKE